MVSVMLSRAMTFVRMTLIAIAGVTRLKMGKMGESLCTTLWTAASLSSGARREETSDRDIERLRALADRVCWFDWSGNDPDAVAAIDDLREALKRGNICGTTRR